MNYGFDQKKLFCNYFYALIISIFEWIRLNNNNIIYLVKDIEKILLSFFNKLGKKKAKSSVIHNLSKSIFSKTKGVEGFGVIQTL